MVDCLRRSIVSLHEANLGIEKSWMPYGMLLLLDFLLCTVLECPLYDVCFRRGSFDMLALCKLGPESVEIL